MQTLSGNAFLIRGTEADVPQVLALLQSKMGIETVGNAELYVRHYKQYGIDTAHDVRTRASSRGIHGRRVFVISTTSITTEAQNALLKTLEEPRDNALFVFIIPTPETLLATVRSRTQILHLDKNSEVGLHYGGLIDSVAFLKVTHMKRIDMLKVILEKDDETYNMALILAFLTSLERSVAPHANIPARNVALEAIYRARMYVTDRGALVKVLLESVALLVPVIPEL